MKNKIKSPTISTLVAELRVVRIGNKQMTKAVFNQLYASKPHDDNYNIVYPIWGKVKLEGEWVIFQNGNDLNKFYIPKPHEGNPYNETDYLYNMYLSTKWFIEAYKHINNGSSILNIDDEEFDVRDCRDYAGCKRDVPDKIKDFIYSFCSQHFSPDTSKDFNKDFFEYSSKFIAYNKMVEALQNAPQLFIAV